MQPDRRAQVSDLAPLSRRLCVLHASRRNEFVPNPAGEESGWAQRNAVDEGRLVSVTRIDGIARTSLVQSGESPDSFHIFYAVLKRRSSTVAQALATFLAMALLFTTLCAASASALSKR